MFGIYHHLTATDGTCFGWQVKLFLKYLAAAGYDDLR